MSQLHKNITKALNALAKPRAEYIKVVKTIQSKCKHSLVVEAPYHPSSFGSTSLPPFRVCTECGLSEDGWGCGYKKLPVAHYETTRDKAYGLQIILGEETED